MSNPSSLRNTLTSLLTTSGARASLDKALANLPADLRGEVPDGLPYSIWQLVEHLRIAQGDILEFSRNPRYQSPRWPDDYWPAEKAPAGEEAWLQSLHQISADRDAFNALLTDEENDLLTPFPWGEGQTLLREALVLIDHNSYHTAEIIVLRRLMGTWS